MAREIRQQDQEQELRQRLNRLRERAEEYRGRLSPEDLRRAPPAGGWSIGVVFEHLCIAEDTYHEAMEARLAAAASDPGAPAATWRPSLAGGLLVRSFRSPRKMAAPGIYQPGPEPRPGVIDAYLERIRRTGELLSRASGVRWRAIRLSSPVSRLIRINLGDGFDILVTHAERHYDQIERIKGSLGIA